ncbi:hypothetical protein D3C86_1624370 [compost metagenome]
MTWNIAGDLSFVKLLASTVTVLVYMRKYIAVAIRRMAVSMMMDSLALKRCLFVHKILSQLGIGATRDVT